MIINSLVYHKYFVDIPKFIIPISLIIILNHELKVNL